VVAEAQLQDRDEVRYATKEALAALMQLVREKKVKRHRRQWVSAIHNGHPRL